MNLKKNSGLSSLRDLLSLSGSGSDGWAQKFLKEKLYEIPRCYLNNLNLYSANFRESPNSNSRDELPESTSDIGFLFRRYLRSSSGLMLKKFFNDQFYLVKKTKKLPKCENTGFQLNISIGDRSTGIRIDMLSVA